MTQMLNERQLAFVREYQIDHNGAAAYVRAGYSPNGANVAASRLLTNVSIKKLIAAQAVAHAERNDITIDSLTGMYRTAYDLAEDTKQAGAMNGSVTGIAKLHGLIQDKPLVDQSITVNMVRYG